LKLPEASRAAMLWAWAALNALAGRVFETPGQKSLVFLSMQSICILQGLEFFASCQMHSTGNNENEIFFAIWQELDSGSSG